MALVGIRECARILEKRGVQLNASTITRQVQAGIIPNHGTADGKPLVDPDEVIAARARNVDPSKQRGPDSPLFGAPADDGSEVEETAAAPSGKREVSFSAARTASEAYKARMAQLDLEERLGNLVDKQEVVDFFTEAGLILRQGLMLRSGDMAGRLVGLSNPSEIAAIIKDEDRKLLERLAEEFSKRFNPAAENVAA